MHTRRVCLGEGVCVCAVCVCACTVVPSRAVASQERSWHGAWPGLQEASSSSRGRQQGGWTGQSPGSEKEPGWRVRQEVGLDPGGACGRWFQGGSECGGGQGRVTHLSIRCRGSWSLPLPGVLPRRACGNTRNTGPPSCGVGPAHR